MKLVGVSLRNKIMSFKEKNSIFYKKTENNFYQFKITHKLSTSKIY